EVRLLPGRHHRAAGRPGALGEEDPVRGHRHRARDPVRAGGEAGHLQPPDDLLRAHRPVDRGPHRRVRREGVRRPEEGPRRGGGGVRAPDPATHPHIPGRPGATRQAAGGGGGEGPRGGGRDPAHGLRPGGIPPLPVVVTGVSPSRRSGFARPISRLADRLRRRVARLRARYDGVDHLFRALDRYREVFGGRLAAAIAYYGFFATFALGLLAYSVLGFLLEYPAVEEAVAEYLAQNLPVIETRQITAGRGAASLVALLGLLLAGVAWVDTLRSAQRLVW